MARYAEVCATQTTFLVLPGNLREARWVERVGARPGRGSCGSFLDCIVSERVKARCDADLAFASCLYCMSSREAEDCVGRVVLDDPGERLEEADEESRRVALDG